MNPIEEKPSSENDTAGRNSTYVDPAASMSLITQILNNPLDAGYTDHPRYMHTGARRFFDKVLVVIAAFVLGIAFVGAVNVLANPLKRTVENDLTDRAQSEITRVEALESEVADLAAQMRSFSQESVVTDQISAGLKVATASTQVMGSGIIVTVTDGSTQGVGRRSQSSAVRDQDLRMLVNALWSAGAEAISINGNRIAPGTFIRTAGSSILINVTPIASPYEVAAIGDANALSTSLVRGSNGDYISSAESLLGITFKVAAHQEIILPAMDLRVIRHAEPVTPTEGG